MATCSKESSATRFGAGGDQHQSWPHRWPTEMVTPTRPRWVDIACNIMTDASDAFNLDLALSSLGADGGDIQLMFRLLVERLAEALGDRLRVERAGRLRKDGQIRRIEIQLAGTQYIAELQGGAPQFLLARISGGIRIRSESTGVAAWLSALLEALNQEAQHSTVTRQALETIIIGGN